MSGPVVVPYMHAVDKLLVQFLFENQLQAFTANEIADRVPSNIARDSYTSQMSRLFRIHPLVRRRKRRSQMFIPFEYWYGA